MVFNLFEKSLLIESVSRGEYQITDRGSELLETRPVKIDKKLLSQYKEYRIFTNQEEKEDAIKDNDAIEDNSNTPEENQ